MTSAHLLRSTGWSAAFAVVIFAASGVPNTAVAASTMLECPATIQLNEPRATASGLPAGAEIVLDANPLRLTGYNVFDGPPVREAALMPHSDKPGKDGSTAVWTFEGDYSQGKYLSCDYAGGVVRMAQRADDAVKRCTVVSRKSGKPAALQVRFRCE